MLGYLWTRFLWLGLAGKVVTVIAVLYGAGWLAGSVGFDRLAGQLGETALLLLALLLTAAAIRGAWRLSRPPGR
jgi:predicted MFS family arabinose efflux permease